MIRKPILLGVLAAVTTLALTEATAVAAPPGRGAPFAAPIEDRDGGGNGGGYRTFNLAMPIVNFTGETVGHLEFNLAGHATLSLEVTAKRAREEISDAEQAETGESRSSTAKGGALLIARYSQPYSMSGFYWGLGAGYREEEVTWRVRPDEKDPAVDFRLVDTDDRLHHMAVLRGATGHFRVGYRYAGVEVPLLIGGYLGARHFQAGVKDREFTEDELKESDERWAESTDRERERLRRKYASRPEAGLEVGFTF